MSEDIFGAMPSSENPLAIKAFHEAGQALLRHRYGVFEQLGEAVRADPDFVAAHALHGLVQVLLAREETMELARRANKRTQEALGRRKVAAGDRSLALALDAACTGQWLKAADILEAALDQDAPGALQVKIAHSLRFMAGDIAGLLTLTEQYAANDSHDFAGKGFLLGCHAFALEENGLFAEAEPLAQRALHMEPDDIWAMHALAHEYEMTNRTGEGLLWVESGRQQWSGCNNFANHMCWHLALFCLERGKFDRAMAIYDGDLSATLTDDFRDFANAVSFLVRMQQMGVDIGERLDLLHERAAKQAADATYVFASLHNLMPLLGRGDTDNAIVLVEALKTLAADGRGDQAAVARDIGVPLAEALTANMQDKTRVEGLAELAQSLPALGGSFVQRDVFLRSMILMADDVCDHKATHQLLVLRDTMRRADSFSHMVEERMCFGGSSVTIQGAA